MSNSELIPLFPSATHPAIPIASRILSTLRTLTAPGKGNDIKPEERAALVGVAAVLGCEKIQSHDLPASSAQKASSVSPAHFKSALLRARRLLSQAEESSPSPSSSKRTSPRTASAGPSVDPLSPFTTPRKKRTYTSGIDVSDLLKSGSKHAHTPATGSPLRNSSTSIRKEDKEEDVSRTPTKRVKYGTVRGVDLSSVDVEVEEGASARKRRKEDTSAFMALKPDHNATRVVEDVGRGDELPEEEKEYLLSIREKRRTRPSGSRVGLKRKDWTFREGVWGSERVEKRNRVLLDKVFDELPGYLESRGLPKVGETGSTSLAELLST